VVSAGTLAAFLAARPAWLRAQRHLMGAVLAGLAVHLLVDRAPAATR
jgi:threonine/homoserine/homoserine lactone efflux protein